MHLKLILFLLLLVISCATTQQNTTWKAAGFTSKSYQQWLVLAQVNNPLHRRLLEDAMVQELQQQGINASPTYNNITDSEMMLPDLISEKAVGMGGDALIAFSGARVQRQYKDGSTANASVKIPVRTSFGNIWMGGNVPLMSATQENMTITLDASFYDKAGAGPQWITLLQQRVGRQPGDAALALAQKTIQQLRLSGILQP